MKINNLSDEEFNEDKENHKIEKQFVDPVTATSFGWWLLRTIGGICISFLFNNYILGFFFKEKANSEKPKEEQDESRQKSQNNIDDV